MKILVSYPPLESNKGIPLLSQNRQFQWFNNPSSIYPMVPAYAATLLHENGYDVEWADYIAERRSYTQFLDFYRNSKADLVLIETKTPVVKTHWRIIDDLKRLKPECRVVLVGDHVTALPKESMVDSKTDFILTGGDYDFLLLNLCNHLEKDEKLEPGVWYREDGVILDTGRFLLNHDLNKLPFIDRELTEWWLYKENGNYKHLPGTYTMVGRDCWYHKCTFCSWPTLYPEFRVRKPELLLDEIGMLIEEYGIKEVMDDTGTFPVGDWLEEFCQGMIERGYSKKIKLDCNMRFKALNQEQYNLMGAAGFRFILYGLESANQTTLDRLNKGIRVEDITFGVRMAKKAGLDPHLTVMVGYPWETKEDAQRSVDLAKYLFSKGWADTLQATIVIPYPGTPLYDECKANDWLLTEDWDRYDMREPVMKTPMTGEDIKKLTQDLYKVFFTPQYVFRKVFSIRSTADLVFIKRGLKAIYGHLRDFGSGEKCEECK